MREQTTYLQIYEEVSIIPSTQDGCYAKISFWGGGGEGGGGYVV